MVGGQAVGEDVPPSADGLVGRRHRPPSSAAFSVCHDRLAHFTRTGNSDTPENTASLPRVSDFAGRQRAGHQLVEPLEQCVGLSGSCP